MSTNGPLAVALGHDALDQALAHVAHGGQTEDDGGPGRVAVSTAIGRELGDGAVHVGDRTSIPIERHSAR